MDDPRLPVGKLLGRGTYGSVFEVRVATENGTEETLAVKRIDAHDDLAAVWREIATLRALRRCPNIVQYRGYKVHEASACVDVYMERCCAKTLNDLLPVIADDAARMQHVASGLLSGVHSMHERSLVHLDLKPANVLFAEEGAGAVKLCDFSLSRRVHRPLFDGRGAWGMLCDKEAYMSKRVVTAWYRPPELWISEPRHYDPYAVDVWSAGMILLEMALGSPYLKGCKDDVTECLGRIDALVGTPKEVVGTAVRPKMHRSFLMFRKRIGDRASERYIRLAFDMLHPDPEQRPTISAALRHPYFNRLLPHRVRSRRRIVDKRHHETKDG